MRLSAAYLTLLFSCALAQAQYTPANAEWNQPVAPFRIAGNIYYVGAASVSSYLISTPEGLILIDSGFRETAPMVEQGIRKLGFKVEDVKILLTSHAHYDHVGGMADLKAKTHARLLMNPVEMPQMERGGKGDFAFKDTVPFPPVKADGGLREGEAVRLGGVAVTPIFTPGHTKGCTSWSTTVQEAGRTLNVVIPCSLTAPGYQLINNPEYPEILKDFEATIAKLRATPCDIYLALHSWDFDLPAKIAALKSGRNPFVDPDGYQRWITKAEATLRQQAAAQRGK
jgi:metallo-beta-lactamase class B